MAHHLSTVRAKDTRPEWIIRSALHRLGFRFQIHRKDLPGKTDLVFPKYRAVVLVHGCFWHRHMKCRDASMPSTNQEFRCNKFSATINRDSRVLRELHAQGWRTMVIWECKLERDTISTLNTVVKWIGQTKKAESSSLDVGNTISKTVLINAATEKVR
ncbi:MAG: DNA mismatch endonuclease Vsr, partial [Cyanobacteria bacterium K_Offshore_surface_m2_239]|nr:DNA mismatch endonuclease Vsr [Cyanobacteria bacterium K_Offshore_surface_m2_239]